MDKENKLVTLTKKQYTTISLLKKVSPIMLSVARNLKDYSEYAQLVEKAKEILEICNNIADKEFNKFYIYYNKRKKITIITKAIILVDVPEIYEKDIENFDFIFICYKKANGEIKENFERKDVLFDKLEDAILYLKEKEIENYMNIS